MSTKKRPVKFVLKPGDKVLLTNQLRASDNGVRVLAGRTPILRRKSMASKKKKAPRRSSSRGLSKAVSEPKLQELSVTIPIAGCVNVNIFMPEGASEDEIYEAACEAYGEKPEDYTIEWEFHQKIAEGNVLHVSQNEWEYQVEKSADE